LYTPKRTVLGSFVFNFLKFGRPHFLYLDGF